MKPTNNRIFCIGCRRPKMFFVTQAKADNFIRFNREEIVALKGKAPTRSYYCSFCCGWHVTSVADEVKAKADDERDEQIWEKIREFHIENRHFKAVGEKVAERLVCLYSMIQQCVNLLGLTRLSDAVELFKVIDLEVSLIELEVAKPGKVPAKIERLRKRIDNIRITFEIISENDTDSETRLLYLSNEEGVQNRLAAIYFRNKEFIGVVDSLFARLEKARDAGDADEFNKIHEDITTTVGNYRGESIQEKKKEFNIRLSNTRMPVQKRLVSDRQQKKARESYLSVIEILETAHHAVAADDYDRCRNLLKTAECLMPDSSDEISDFLWNQIDGLKSKVF